MGTPCVLKVSPYLSAEVGNRAAFGYYYVDSGDQHDKAPFTLSALRASGDALSVAAANAAWAWVQGAGAEIFATIANIEDRNDGAVRFTHVEEQASGGTRISFHFVEAREGAALELLDEVRVGGDTWDCGDFGDIDRDIASQAGAGEVWAALTAAAGTDNVRLRLTLCDEDADVSVAAQL